MNVALWIVSGFVAAALGVVAFWFVLGASGAARAKDQPEAPAALAKEAIDPADCLYDRLGLSRKDTCGKICPVRYCRGRSRLMRLLCFWLDRWRR